MSAQGYDAPSSRITARGAQVSPITICYGSTPLSGRSALQRTATRCRGRPDGATPPSPRSALLQALQHAGSVPTASPEDPCVSLKYRGLSPQEVEQVRAAAKPQAVPLPRCLHSYSARNPPARTLIPGIPTPPRHSNPTPQAFCAENPGLWRALAGEAATMSPANAAQLLTHLTAELPPALDDVAPCGDSVLVSVAPGLLPLLGEPAQPANQPAEQG